MNHEVALEKTACQYLDSPCIVHSTGLVLWQIYEYALSHLELSLFLKSASNLNGNLNCSKELEHYAS